MLVVVLEERSMLVVVLVFLLDKMWVSLFPVLGNLLVSLWVSM